MKPHMSFLRSIWRYLPVEACQHKQAKCNFWRQIHQSVALRIKPRAPLLPTPPGLPPRGTGKDVMNDLEALVEGKYGKMELFTDTPLDLTKKITTMTREREREVEELSEELMYMTTLPRPTGDVVVEELEQLRAMPDSLEEYFKNGTPRKLYSWNRLLRVHAAKHHPISRGMEVLKDMYDRGHKPNANTYAALFTLLAQCNENKYRVGRMKNCALAFKFNNEMKALGIKPTVATYGALMDVCAKCYDHVRADLVWKLMKEDQIAPNVVIYTSYIIACARSGQTKKAWDAFNEMRANGVEPDSLTYNHIIRLCAETEDAEKAIQLLSEMIHFGNEPSLITYNNLILACAKRKDYYDQSFQFLQHAIDRNLEPDLRTFNNMLRACQWHGDYSTARRLFSQMDRLQIKKNTISYNLIINTLARIAKVHFIEIDGELLSQSQRIQMAHKLLEDMEMRGCAVDQYTMQAVVSVYARSLRIHRAVEALDNLCKKYKIKPTYFCYMTLLRMYSRSKKLYKAMELLETMKKNDCPPDHETYRILLVMCRHMRDMERGQQVLSEMRSKGYEPSEFDAKPFEPKDPPLFDPPQYDRYFGDYNKGLGHTGRRKDRKPKVKVTKETHKLGFVPRKPIKRFL